MGKEQKSALKDGTKMRSKDDTLGSYTGVSSDESEPIQDADDL